VSTTSSDAPASLLKKRAVAITSSIKSQHTPPEKPHPSITREEKEAFNKLLDKLGSQLPPQKQENLEKSEFVKEQLKRDKIVPSQENQENASSSRGPESKEQSEISAIFNEAVEDVKAGRNKPVTPEELTKRKQAHPKMGRARSTLEVERERISRIIERIRRFKYSDVDISERARQPMSIERIIEMVVQRESKKIEAALQSAIDEGKGDIGLWEVCQERVFGILQHLKEDDAAKWERLLNAGGTPNFHAGGSSGEQENRDLNAAANIPEPATASQPKETADAGSLPVESIESSTTSNDNNEEPKTPPPGTTSTSTTSTTLEIPPFVPTYPVVSVLYPEMILSAFRLLNNHFPNSPLISQILPTIKSYGRRSVILGSSTPLYNELIYYHWNTCDDLSTVVSLLEEMHVTGVEPDRQTYELVKWIVQQYKKELTSYRRRMRQRRGQKKGGDRSLWTDTDPNEQAFRELKGHDGRPGWVRRLRKRLREIDERRKMDEVPIRTIKVGGYDDDQRQLDEKEEEKKEMKAEAEPQKRDYNDNDDDYEQSVRDDEDEKKRSQEKNLNKKFLQVLGE